MGKTIERMNTLSNILNNSDEAHVEIDDAPTEFKRGPGRPKKIVIQPQEWAGMTVPGEIYKICIFIKQLLVKTNRYAEEMELQIYNAAVQQYLYNRLITEMITGKDIVPTRSIVTCSESLRRAYQALGLTIMDKHSAITRENQGTNPLADFLGKMDDTPEEEIVAKKPKKKGAK